MAEDTLKNLYKLIVIGGSAGSLDAVFKILSHLDKTFTLPILLVLHRNTSPDSGLIQVLAEKTHYHVKEAEEKEKIRDGVIYIAPADYHLLVEADGTLSLDVSEKVNYSRPSIDVTFETASNAYGEQLICIVLSGASVDGAAGVAHATQNNSKVIVQDPAEAIVSYMPIQSLLKKMGQLVLNTQDISTFLNRS